MSLKTLTNLYEKYGFKVETLLMNPSFESMQDYIDSLLGPTLNTMSTKEQMTGVDIMSFTLKDCVKGIIITLLYNVIPDRMIIELVNFVIMWITPLPPSSRQNFWDLKHSDTPHYLPYVG